MEPPRWVWVWLVSIALLLSVTLIAIGGVTAVVAVGRQHRIESTQRAQVATSARNDCRATISTARRSVFDNVDIYKAIQIEQLSTALLNAQQGIPSTAADIEAFAANDANLRTALVEARRLQPAGMLDDIIEHGGVISGRHYNACPRVK